MRITVVGGGVVGLLTAVECVRAPGVTRVELVDAGPIPSPTATSNDRLRVVRALHRGEPALTSAAARAHTGWLEVESLIGSRFYHPSGALTAMPERNVAGELAVLITAGARAWGLSPTDLAGRYPWIRFPAGSGAVLEATAGVVLADHALVAMARWLGSRPQVRLHPHQRVVEVTQHEHGGLIRFADGKTRTADRVVVAAGPWSRELVPAAVASDLTLCRQSVLSYRPQSAGMPAVLGLGSAGDAWLMSAPAHSDASLRLSAASACRPAAGMTDRDTPDRWREHLIGVFSEVLAGFDPAAVVDCFDGFYLSERARGGPLLASYGAGAIWAYAACGGMSFKFAPQIARALADRVVGATPRPTGLESVDQPRFLAAAGKE